MQFFTRMRVQVTRRFISQKHHRLIRKGPSYRNPLLLSTGELSGTMFQAPVESHGSQQLPSPFPGRPPTQSRDEARHHHIFERRKLPEKMVKLKHEPDSLVSDPCESFGVEGRHVPPADPYLARRWLIQCAQQVQQCRLTRTTATDDGYRLSGLDVELYPLQYG